MTNVKRWSRLLIACGIALGMLSFFSFRLAAQSIPFLQSASPEDPIGDPCGAGELLFPDAICLHGSVAFVGADGNPVYLNGVVLTATLGDRQVTGTTFVHPQWLTPTFGLDIRTLAPGFLQPITLTVRIRDLLIERQVLINPDFATRNQEFNLWVSPGGGGVLASPPLWGYVTDFAAGGPVTQALVTVERGAVVLTATTAFTATDPQPIYYFTAEQLALLQAGIFDPITLTAQYGGDVDRRVAVLNRNSVQVNFATGWRCDSFNPLPQTGGGHGMPQTGGGHGMPNIGCFWGYAVVDGQPQPGVMVQLEISGTTYVGKTELYPGETQPRYGIVVWDALNLDGASLTLTAIYSGVVVTRPTTVALDPALSQRSDMAIGLASHSLASFGGAEPVQTVLVEGNDLWFGTENGLVRRRLTDGNVTRFWAPNGPAGTAIYAVARDAQGALWVETERGLSRYASNETVAWTNFFTDSVTFSLTMHALAVAPDDSIWVGARGWLAHYYFTGSARTWETITLGSELWNADVRALAAAPDGSLWIGLGNPGGLVHYRPGMLSPWEVFTSVHGLLPGPVQALALDSAGTVWAGSAVGVSRYDPALRSWQTLTTFLGLPSANVQDLTVTLEGVLWLVTPEGAVRYDHRNGYPSWQIFTPDHGLAGGNLTALSVVSDTEVWFATAAGVSRYRSTELPVWETFGATRGELGAVKVMVPQVNGSIWFGTANGVSLYQPENQPQRVITPTWLGLFDNQVTALAAENDGSLWVGTANGVLHYWYGTEPAWQLFNQSSGGLRSDDIRSILVADDGAVWFGGAGGVSRYQPAQEPAWSNYDFVTHSPDNFVNVMVRGPEGSLWFGMNDGVMRYAPGELLPWRFFTLPVSSGEIITPVSVQSLATASDGSIWLGSAPCGLYHYFPGDLMIREKIQCPAICATTAFSVVKSLVTEPGGAVLVGIGSTASGATEGCLFRYHAEGDATWELLTGAGEIAPYSGGGVARSADGSLWFSTEGGVQQIASPTPLSNLAVSVAAPERTVFGMPLHYTFFITNLGRAAALSTWLQITAPEGISLTASTAFPFDGSLFDLGPINAGSAVRVDVTGIFTRNFIPGDRLRLAASVSSDFSEAYYADNVASGSTLVRAPDRVDLRLAFSPPPSLTYGRAVVLQGWIDNGGELDALTSTLNISLPMGLTATISGGVASGPVAINRIMAPLPAGSPPLPFTVVVTAVATPPPTGWAMPAQLIPMIPEENSLNNQAVVTISPEVENVQTLILVAPERMVSRYGVTPLLSELSRLAAHSRVRGRILDVMNEPRVRAAYRDWDAAPNDPLRANAVAAAIKTLIDYEAVSLPQLRYLVIVGNDYQLPFYRVVDRNLTTWRERSYAFSLPGGSVRASLADNFFFTDDFYADQIPTIPTSSFWYDHHPLYLPDFAVGRLIETPTEISATIQTFLSGNNSLVMNTALNGYLPGLTEDSGIWQCSAWQAEGISPQCTGNAAEFRAAFRGRSAGWVGAAFHSNHRSLGPLDVEGDLAASTSLSQMLIATIGCHAGLNVPDGGEAEPDVAQRVAARGGILIAPTAYAYAGRDDLGEGISYSEALMQQLTQQLLVSTTQEIGPALARAKHAYYVSHGWFDYTDEKVLLAMTLYGLPMVQVQTPAALVRQAAASPSWATRESTSLPVLTLVTYTLSRPKFNQQTTQLGRYYDWDGELLMQQGRPLQPARGMEIPTVLEDGRTVRGVTLHSTAFEEKRGFNPVIFQSWAVGEPGEAAATELLDPLAEWDRMHPYALGLFEGRDGRLAHLSFVVGAYQARTQTERTFQDVQVVVYYSDQADTVPPTIVSVFLKRGLIGAVLADDQEIVSGEAVCETPDRRWQPYPLLESGEGRWQTELPLTVSRCYLQIVDGGGNVTTGAWLSTMNYRIYLPIVYRQ